MPCGGREIVLLFRRCPSGGTAFSVRGVRPAGAPFLFECPKRSGKRKVQLRGDTLLCRLLIITPVSSKREVPTCAGAQFNCTVHPQSVLLPGRDCVRGGGSRTSGVSTGARRPLSVARKGEFLRGKTLSRKVFPLKCVFAYFRRTAKVGRHQAKRQSTPHRTPKGRYTRGSPRPG